MQGIQIDNHHTYFDWGLILRYAPTISAPAVKEKLIDVPGLDGALDLTEAMGPARYDMRTIQADFTLIGPRDTWTDRHAEILNAIHGKKCTIVMDDDTEWYYTGRVSVSELKPYKADAAYLTIRVKAEPYKHRRYGNGVRL